MGDTAPRLTPKRLAFLRAAAARGECWRDQGHVFNRANYFHAGGERLLEQSGDALTRLGLIEPMPRADGRPGTEPMRAAGGGYTMGWRYRVTEAGRQAARS